MESSAARKVTLISDRKEPEFKDGDDGGDGTSVLAFSIEIAANGFVLTATMDDLSEYKEIHEEIDDVFKSIKGMV